MPTPARRSLPFPASSLIPLLAVLLACAAVLILSAASLGGSPTGRPRPAPYRDASPTDLPAEQLPSPITVVVIDAGHGGEDGGASSASGVVEKNVNLAVSFALRDLLEAAGIPVVMTRTEDKLLYDRNVDFQGRKKVLDLAARRLMAEKTAKKAAENGAQSLFISIHMNAFPQAQYSGMQVWYGAHSPASHAIADAIQKASAPLMPDNHRKTKAAGSNIYLLDRIGTPAVLVECGFLSNPAEADRLAQGDYQKALAATIFAAVAPYLTAP